MICQICYTKHYSQRHHKFPQTKVNRKTYGKLLDEPFNLLEACDDCHTSHNKITSNYNYSEYEFRLYAKKFGYELPKPTKSYKEGMEDIV